MYAYHFKIVLIASSSTKNSATYTPVLEAWNNIIAHLDVVVR